MSKNELQGWKFSFLIFSNHVFWRKFNGGKVGGMIFSLQFPIGWTIIFLYVFKKSCHYVLWGKSIFLKIEFPMGWRIIFFFKNVVIIYYGENALFSIDISWRYVLWEKHVFFITWLFSSVFISEISFWSCKNDFSKMVFRSP